MATTLTIRLKPKVHYCANTYGTGHGYDTSAGVWIQASGDCSTYLDEGQAALDEKDYGYLRSRGTVGDYAPGRFEHTFSSLPSGLTITKVRIVAYLRTSNGGAESIDESPRVKGFVNPTGTRYYQTGPTYVTVTNPWNRQTHSATGSYARQVCGEWATNPETTVAWTLPDLVEGTFKAGIEAGGIAEGQAGNGVPPTTGGSSASLDAAVIELEVEAASTDFMVDPIRAILSRLLRLRRRPLRPVRLEVPAPLAHAAPGDVVYVAEPFWPTPGATGLSALEWDRRPLFVLESEERVSAHVSSLVAWDLREHMCSFWSPFHTDLGGDDQWTGLAYLDQGAGKTVARAQAGWIWRPGDNLWRDAASGKWRITPWGLLICGGAYSGSGADTGEETWYPLNATFSQGTGGEGTSLANTNTTGFTGWTVSKAGTGTAVVKQDSVYLFDVATYRRAVRLTQGTPWATNYAFLYSSTAGFTATQHVRVHLKFRPVAESYGFVAWKLARTTGPDGWNEVTRTWGAAVWNRVAVTPPGGDLGDGLASLRLCGDHYEYWSSEIVVGGTGAQTLTFSVGDYVVSGAVDIFDAGFVSTGAATGAGATVIRREFLAPTTAALTQAADVVDLNNTSSYHILEPLHGTLTAIVTPLWDHEDLADGAKKYVASFVHEAVVPTVYDTVYYERINSTTGRWRFFRSTDAAVAEFVVTSAAGTLPGLWTPVNLTVRWTSNSGELGLATRSLSVHVNGVAGTPVASAVDPTGSPSHVALGRLSTGAAGSSDTPDTYLDGMLAHVEILPFCLSDLEIARRHAQLSLADLPVAMGPYTLPD